MPHTGGPQAAESLCQVWVEAGDGNGQDGVHGCVLGGGSPGPSYGGADPMHDLVTSHTGDTGQVITISLGTQLSPRGPQLPVHTPMGPLSQGMECCVLPQARTWAHPTLAFCDPKWPGPEVPFLPQGALVSPSDGNTPCTWPLQQAAGAAGWTGLGVWGPQRLSLVAAA
jgi:hypothetical protein